MHLCFGPIRAFLLIPEFVRFEMHVLVKGRLESNTQACPCDCRNDADWTCHIQDSFATVPKEGRSLKETFEYGSTTNGSASERNMLEVSLPCASIHTTYGLIPVD